MRGADGLRQQEGAAHPGVQPSRTNGTHPRPGGGVPQVAGQREAEPRADGGPLIAAIVGTSSRRIDSQAR